METNTITTSTGREFLALLCFENAIEIAVRWTTETRILNDRMAWHSGDLLERKSSSFSIP